MTTGYKTWLYDEDREKVLPGVIFSQIFLEDGETPFSTQYEKDLVEKARDKALTQRLGLAAENANLFNWATLVREDPIYGSEEKIRNVEHWLLINAIYDEATSRFKRVDPTSHSFGIQMQGMGAVPDKQNTGKKQGVAIWKTLNQKEITDLGLELPPNNEIGYVNEYDQWVEFNTPLGWDSQVSFNSDSNIFVGGNGLELGGDGIFPKTRITVSKYYDGVAQKGYALHGLLLNNSFSLQESDNEDLKSFFLGLRSEFTDFENKIIDTNTTEFVFMEKAAKDPNAVSLPSWKVILSYPKDLKNRLFLTKCLGKNTQAVKETQTISFDIDYPYDLTNENTNIFSSKVQDVEGNWHNALLKQVNYNPNGIHIEAYYDFVVDPTTIYALVVSGSPFDFDHLINGDMIAY